MRHTRDAYPHVFVFISCAALFIADKFECRSPQHVRRYVTICGRAVTASAIMDMERQMLSVLHFHCGCPTSYSVLCKLCHAGRVDPCVHRLAAFYCELAAQDYAMAAFYPSAQACAGLSLALLVSGKPAWVRTSDFWSDLHLCGVHEKNGRVWCVGVGWWCDTE